ncbi:MAG: hypothetical protein DME54_07295 [Verrucomicrobia bacterium]|nr:MAG: hypothetical protein DMF09_09020 [Verrucomicrobiota bacterium]PYK34737.1 MAG: hypothetical protein DME54_07295 [Verrucomicrobiota bacterium]PYL18899.1 MAG: hypothetical protein DMF41_11115 [Verrucomicrobiota bacterium]PYL79214.1 MAG: hypothetical protein DMF21_13515 [Verrucomicrobiota bacterium]
MKRVIRRIKGGTRSRAAAVALCAQEAERVAENRVKRAKILAKIRKTGGSPFAPCEFPPVNQPKDRESTARQLLAD